MIRSGSDQEQTRITNWNDSQIQRQDTFWFKEWIFFFVDGNIHPEKKNNGKLHMLCFCHSFFRMDTPSTNKTNKFIPYHLNKIISKHKYYGIKRYIFLWFVYALYILRRLSILWRLSIASQIDGYKNPSNFSTNRKACYMEN
jgi:hypothetical protein